LSIAGGANWLVGLGSTWGGIELFMNICLPSSPSPCAKWHLSPHLHPSGVSYLLHNWVLKVSVRGPSGTAGLTVILRGGCANAGPPRLLICATAWSSPGKLWRKWQPSPKGQPAELHNENIMWVKNLFSKKDLIIAGLSNTKNVLQVQLISARDSGMYILKTKALWIWL
jgi:hypothetical protein